MRTHKIGNITIEYPDELCFVFNQQNIVVTTSGNVTTNIYGGKTFIDERSPYSGKVKIDISSYLRALFSPEDNQLIKSKEVTVGVRTNGYYFEFTLTCIWGVINIGEIFNGKRQVTWFRRFPFTFSMYIAAGSKMKTRFDEQSYSNVVSNAGLVHLTPAELFPDADDFAVIRLEAGVSKGGAFEYTFDNTFRRVGDGTIINRLVIDDSECGVYLRWIDRHGFYQYYLLKDGDKVSQSANEGESMNQEYSDSKYSYNGVSRYQGRTMKRTIKACATLVNKETFNMLSTLHSSPLVDLYVNGNWVPVNIVPGSFTDSGADLQDFEIQITMPEIITQML